MNLFELAHHPDAFKDKDCKASKERPSEVLIWWGDKSKSTDEQFTLLQREARYNEKPEDHTDENEFRMHLLFVHWATLPESEMVNGLTEEETLQSKSVQGI